MRPAAGIAALILAAVALAFFTSHLRPAPDPPPNEKPDDTTTSQTDTKKSSATSATAEAPAAFPSDGAGRKAYFDKFKTGAVHGTMEIEGRGTLTFELYPAATPKTVAHWTELAKKNFFDGILFHRVEPDFVAQAGDPNSKKLEPKQLQGLSSQEVGAKFSLGGGGSGQNVPLEAKLPHAINSIGLARSSDPDSGDSQFYFNLKDNASLDGQYCVFGMVTDGADVLPKIQIGDRIKHVAIQ